MQRCSAPCVERISELDYSTDILSSQDYLASSGKKSRNLMLSQMKKLADEFNFEKAQELKQRIASLDILQQEQAFSTNLASIDFFAFVEKYGKTGACILSARDGKIRGTKTYFFKENLLINPDMLIQSLVFSYYQNSFSLPDKMIFTVKPKNLKLISEAINLKFQQVISMSCSTPPGTKQLTKLAKFNASQVIENKIGKSDKFDHAMQNLAKHLGLNKTNLIIEGYDVSHHSGKYAVASCVKYTNSGPDKKSYRLFNIPAEIAGNDFGSMQHVLERRMKNLSKESLPDIILIDGGQQQLNAALKIFMSCARKSPKIISIVKGAKRIRATETILAEEGIIEMPKESPGFLLLQQIRDGSHRFAIRASRRKKTIAVKFSQLESIPGVGPILRERLFKKFKTIPSIKKANIEELMDIKGISYDQAHVIFKKLDAL
jgi:excinuclease ABC subunit C